MPHPHLTEMQREQICSRFPSPDDAPQKAQLLLCCDILIPISTNGSAVYFDYNASMRGQRGIVRGGFTLRLCESSAGS